MGKALYFVGGPTALALARPRLQAGLAKAGMEGVFGVHAGQVLPRSRPCKEGPGSPGTPLRHMVVAVGGGRAIEDFGKLVAVTTLGTRGLAHLHFHLRRLHALQPALHAGTGRAIPGDYCYPLENAAVSVDLDVVAGPPSPPASVIAGALDAMAKWLEIRDGSPAC